GTAGQGFGGAVAIDGNTLIVGAANDNTFGADSGAAYIFTRVGGSWTQQAKLKALDGSTGSTFGQSVAISGNSVVIGAAGGSTDAAYVFTRSGTTWTQQAKIQLGDHSSDFGAAVAISANTIAIGAPLTDIPLLFGGSIVDAGDAYIYTRSGSTW